MVICEVYDEIFTSHLYLRVFLIFDVIIRYADLSTRNTEIHSAMYEMLTTFVSDESKSFFV